MGNEQGRMLSPEELRAREISQMDSEMKKKLSGGGIKYNIKVVIKGDRNTGKTNLWRRLQGLPYQEAYIPTPEIQIATINWSYKVSDDVVKVEVWDVVDKAKPKKKVSSGSSLKLSTADDDDDDDGEDESNIGVPSQGEVTRTGSFAVNSLDANTVDVLRGAHAVIIMVDPTKKWTWDYAQREVPKIAAENIYTLVLANYRDMGEHRVVTEYEIKEFCREQGDMVKCLEASMLNGYGIKSVVSFFNIPFLYMQRQYIQQQLDRNMDEIRSAEDELKVITKEQGYDFYLKWLAQTMKDKKAKKQQPTPQPQVQAPPPSQPQPIQSKQEPPRQAPPAKQEPPKPNIKQAPKPQPPASTSAGAAAPPPVAASKSGSGSGFFSRIFGNKPEEKKAEPVPQLKKPAAQPQKKIDNADDFAPAEELDDGFFGSSPENSPPPQRKAKETKKPQLTKTPTKPAYSDSDDDAPNPLVAKDMDLSDDDTPNPLVARDEGDSDEDVKPVVKAKPAPKKAAPKVAPKAASPKPSPQPKVAEPPKPAPVAPKKVASPPPTKPVVKTSQVESDDEPPVRKAIKKDDDFYSDDDAVAPAIKNDDFYSDDDDATPVPAIKKDDYSSDDAAPPALKKEDDYESDEPKPAPKKAAVIKKDVDEDEKPKKAVPAKKAPVKKAPVIKRDEGEDDDDDTPSKAPVIKLDEDDEDDDVFYGKKKSSDSVRREELRSSTSSPGSGREGRERGERRERRGRGDREKGERRERRSRPEGERERRPKPEEEPPKRDEYEEPEEDNEVFSSKKITSSPELLSTPTRSLSSSPAQSSPPPIMRTPQPASSAPAPSPAPPPPHAPASTSSSTDAFDFAPEEGGDDGFYSD